MKTTNVQKIGERMYEAAIYVVVISAITWILGSVFTAIGMTVDTVAINFICSEPVLAAVGLVGFIGLIMQETCTNKDEGSDE